MNREEILRTEKLGIRFTQYERGLRQRTLETVRDMDLTLVRGEMTAVVGASGSGKSLLAHAILGILPYNASMEGRIFYRGQLLDEKRIKALRGREIVLVPQSVACLDPLMKVGDQVCRGRKDPETRSRMQSIFAGYNLRKETPELYPFQLSGGMSRRVLISAAMMEDPSLVIADEPTPGLDPGLAKRVMSHFREFAERGAAVLVITHDLELALETADRVVIFYEGRAVDQVTPEEFTEGTGLSHPYTKALWRAKWNWQ